MTINFDSNITQQLLQQRTMRLPAELLSGKTFEFTIKDKGDFEAFDSFLQGRYCDAELIWDNRVMKDPNQENDIFPQVYTIDASALLLAYYNVSEGGLGMLGNKQLVLQLSKIMQQAQDAIDSNSVLQEIQMCDDPDMQLDQDEDDEDYDSNNYVDPDREDFARGC